MIAGWAVLNYVLFHAVHAFHFTTNYIQQARTAPCFSSSSSSSNYSRQAAEFGLVHSRLLAAKAAEQGTQHSSDDAPSATMSAEDEIRGETRLTEDNAFDLLAGRSALCLLESDIRRDAIGKEAGTQASSATNWINDASAFALQKAFDQLRIKLPDERSGLDRDESSSWIRWMKTVPSPMIVDFSELFRDLVDAALSDKSYELIDQTKADFLNRVGCRMILLPSGASLPRPLSEFPASIIYGKLLYGGLTRSRLLVSSNSPAPPRQAGVRQAIKTRAKENIPVWMMYGGPDRMYEGMDIGPAAILEVVLLPRGKSLQEALKGYMVIDGFGWSPRNMFDFVGDGDEEAVNGSQELTKDDANAQSNGYSPSSLSGQERNEAFRSNFESSVGGLQPQIDAIVRRVLDGRIIRPAENDDFDVNGYDGDNDENGAGTGDRTSSELSTNALEADELALIGLTPVRGLLLYGPPGKYLHGRIGTGMDVREYVLTTNVQFQFYKDAERQLWLVKFPQHYVHELPKSFRRRSFWIDGLEVVRSWFVDCLQMPRLNWLRAMVMPVDQPCMSL